MYLSHFGLDEPPFRITPHTDFFFDGANRGATLEALLYAITHDEGIVKVSGEVGSGKTMLCRVLMERLPKNVEIIYLSNPSLSRDEILLAIADELKLNVAANRTAVLLRALQEHLIKIYAGGHQVVVLIDEAHAMPLETLEEIRLLSNLESTRHKLLQIVLFGQPELDENLNIPQMRQLKERITHSFRLEPLIRDDIAQYVMFRMRAAGYRGPDIFSPGAIRLITKASLGLTRRINILSDKALLAAFAENAHLVTVKHVKAAVRDSEFRPAPGRAGVAWIVAGVAAAGIAIGYGLRVAEPAPAPGPVTQVRPIVQSPAAQAEGMAPKPETPAHGAPAPTPATPAGGTAPVAQQAFPGNPPPAQMPPHVAPGNAGAKASPPPASPAAAAPATKAATAGVPTAPQTALPSQENRGAARLPVRAGDEKSVAPAPAVGAGAAPAHAGALTRARIEATDAWLREAPGKAFAIQVMAIAPGSERELEAFLERARKVTGLDQVYIYDTRIKGQAKNGLAVVYGSYVSRDAVRETMQSFPAEIRNLHPYLRTVDGIRREIADRDRRQSL